jgi:shikimate dehydrogenase
MNKKLAVIGHPISHSLSPLMHNNELKIFNLPYYYEAIDAPAENLNDVIQKLCSPSVAGFNVTIPHKETVISYLDEIDEEAAEIGAVNTVVNQQGRLVGYNTDGIGFMQALTKLCPNWSDKSIMIVGAGGAAKAIFVTLFRNGASVLHITNRNKEKAEKLLIEANAYDSKALTVKEAERMLHNYDIVINTTPVGMASSNDDIDELPINLDNLKKDTILSDIIYTPLKTRWLQQGERKGATIMNGLDMFIYQGAIAFKYWTGVVPDEQRMKQIVYNHLKERNSKC